MSDSLIFIAIGISLFLSAPWVGCLFSDLADRSEKEGVIRYGGGLPGNKVWRESEPEKFESRIDGLRFSAECSRWFIRIGGALLVVGGATQLIGGLAK